MCPPSLIEEFFQNFAAKFPLPATEFFSSTKVPVHFFFLSLSLEVFIFSLSALDTRRWSRSRPVSSISLVDEGRGNAKALPPRASRCRLEPR